MGREPSRSNADLDARSPLASKPGLAALTQFLTVLGAAQTDPSFIAVEGGVCAGKTTVIRELPSNRITVLAEYTELAEYAGPPVHWPRTVTELTNRLDHFLTLERVRRRGIRNPAPPVVADRSILSLIAFESCPNTSTC